MLWISGVVVVDLSMLRLFPLAVFSRMHGRSYTQSASRVPSLRSGKMFKK